MFYRVKLNGGESSSLTLLGVTLFGKGVSPFFQLSPKVLKSFLGGVEGGHNPPPLMVMSNEVRISSFKGFHTSLSILD
jgi:hypothetical protein